MSIVSLSAFSMNTVCYYQISAPSTAKDGQLLYLNMISAVKVSFTVTIAESTNGDLIYCDQKPGDVIVAVHPQKFFVSFIGDDTNGSKFFLNAWYDTQPTPNTPFVNSVRCADNGRSVAFLSAQQANTTVTTPEKAST